MKRIIYECSTPEDVDWAMSLHQWTGAEVLVILDGFKNYMSKPLTDSFHPKPAACLDLRQAKENVTIQIKNCHFWLLDYPGFIMGGERHSMTNCIIEPWNESCPSTPWFLQTDERNACSGPVMEIGTMRGCNP